MRDIEAIMKSNPRWSYGYAVGYLSGREAANLRQQYAGLSDIDWRNATDDYAHGYRAGYREIEALLMASAEASDETRVQLSCVLREKLASFDPKTWNEDY